MKKLSLVIMSLLLSAAVFAQSKSVTKFLGIPVDGSKAEMIQKLKEKGYTYNPKLECLEGEFNGRDVLICVVTNNNKVYRIFVKDANLSDESDIKIRFNNLCRQFTENKRYFPVKADCIPDEEDISFEMTVHNKRYQASYYQYDVQELMEKLAACDKASEDAVKASFAEDAMNHSVWFMIGEEYGRYCILMFYDNVYNQANGDDL